MTESRNIYVFPNVGEFTDSELANVTVLGLKREGLGYTEVDADPTGREFTYDFSSGRFVFDTNIHDSVFTIGRFIPEVINVLYKI